MRSLAIDLYCYKTLCDLLNFVDQLQHLNNLHTILQCYVVALKTVAANTTKCTRHTRYVCAVSFNDPAATYATKCLILLVERRAIVYNFTG